MEESTRKPTAEILRNLAIIVAVVTVLCGGVLLALDQVIAGVSVLVLALPLIAVLLYLSVQARKRPATDIQPRRQRRTGAALVAFGAALTLGGGVLAAVNADFLARWLLSAGPGFALGGVVAVWLARGQR